MTMDPNQQNAMLQPVMHAQMESHIIAEQLNHPSINHHQHHSSINHPQMNHPQMNSSSMECASTDLTQQESQLNNSTIHCAQLNHLNPQPMGSSSMVLPPMEEDTKMNIVLTPQSSEIALVEPKDVPPMDAFIEPNPDLTCDICGKTYDNKRFLNYHYTSTHKQQKKNIKCAFLLQGDCTERFRNRKNYEEHLQTEHKYGLTQEILQFNDISEFELWKHKMEEDTESHFVLNRGGNKYKNGQTVRNYKCNRSGEKPRLATGKKSKKQPEKYRAMGAECPAYIRAVITDSKVDVTFISSHIGHTVDTLSRSSHREAKKRIALKRMKLEEKQQAFNMRRIRQDRLVAQRNDIIQDLNCLDLTDDGFRGDRIEKLLHMIRLSIDMYKDADRVDELENGNRQMHTGDNNKRPTIVISDSVQDIINNMY